MLNLKNTLDGYLKNVEVIGNTIQDANNLADIRSVGDKVEGQELYKIPVVSCGKNILSEIWRDGRNGKVDTYCGFKLQLDVNKTYTISIKYKRTIPSTEDVLGAISPLVNPNAVKSKLPNKIYQTIFSRSVLHNSMTFSSNCMQDDGTCYLTIYPGNNATDFELFNSFVEGFIESIQIEEGTQATPYEPYQEDKLEILSPVQLEKVGNVADRIICKDGVWGIEKNIGVVVLDGNESWGMTTGGLTAETRPNTRHFYSVVLDGKINKKYDIGICSALSKQYVYGEDVVGFSFALTSVNCLRIGHTSKTLPEFKSWLSQSNVYFKYIQAETQFIPLPHDQQVKLRTFAGQTNIAFLTEIPGQVKAQVPKSLGAVVNTHTEQIEMLHNALKSVLAGDMYSLATILYPEDFEQNDNIEQDIMVIPE